MKEFIGFGFFGKLPSEREFVSFNFGGLLAEAFEPWLFHLAAEVNVSEARKAYFNSDVISLKFNSTKSHSESADKTAEEGHNLGWLVPSVDSLGRVFPFLLLDYRNLGELSPTNNWESINPKVISVLQRAIQEDISAQELTLKIQCLLGNDSLRKNPNAILPPRQLSWHNEHTRTWVVAPNTHGLDNWKSVNFAQLFDPNFDATWTP